MKTTGIERWTPWAGCAFIVLYIAAFASGIDDIGSSDREILSYYADGSNRVKQIIAFFLISVAVLSLVWFAAGLRSRIASLEDSPAALAAFVWGGGTSCATLLLAGNAVSRSTAVAAYDERFQLDPNAWRLVDEVGSLLFVSGALAAIPLVAGVSRAALRYGVLPRWLGRAGYAAAVLLPLAFAFVGFLALFLWVIAVSVTLARRPRSTT
jgi:hypothetical protein